jgi:hypothetical protein
MVDRGAQGTDASARIAQELGALDARAWAQLLRALRRLPEPSDALKVLLELPTSALATGGKRIELCELLGRDAQAGASLLADPALPSAAHAALSPALATAGDDPAEDSAPATDAAMENGDGRSASRLRELRRELTELRRQRDGAEVRAGVAEARASEADAARASLEERVVTLELQLEQAREEVTQAVARAERRAATRTGELERALAAERSALEVLRRERERDRVTLDALRSELDDLRARPAATSTPSTGGARPLVLPEEFAPDTTAAARWLLDGAQVLLVDGYNVSLALRAGHPLIEQRRWLVERLRPLASRGKAAPVVVFDGEGAGRTQRDPSGVEVRFTASGVIADDEIVFAVAATDEPVLVITDDVELQQRVRAEGGNVLGTIHLLGAIEG